MIAVFIALAHVALAFGVSAHIILTKDDVRLAIGWVGLVWLAPVLGSVLYMALGVNRISRRAGAMRGRAPLDAEDRALAPPIGTHAACDSISSTTSSATQPSLRRDSTPSLMPRSPAAGCCHSRRSRAARRCTGFETVSSGWRSRISDSDSILMRLIRRRLHCDAVGSPP